MDIYKIIVSLSPEILKGKLNIFYTNTQLWLQKPRQQVIAISVILYFVLFSDNDAET